MPNRITLRNVYALTLALFAMAFVATSMVSCTEQPPDVPTVTAVAGEGVEAAQEHVQAVLVALEEAERALAVAPKLHDALVSARASYDAKRYSEAVGHLRKAVAEAESAGYQVPPKLIERLGLAEILLGAVGS